MEKKKSTRTKILYARYQVARDAMGQPTSEGMAIFDSQRKLLGFMPYTNFRVEKIRTIHVSGYKGKALVKLLPPLKRG